MHLRLKEFLALGMAAAVTVAAPTLSLAKDLPPIKIGLAAPMTGPNAVVGEGAERGVRLAIEDLGGAIGDRKLQLSVVDDKCTPGDAVPAIRRLVDQEEVDAIIGPMCSGSALAALPIIQEGGVPQLSVTASNPDIYDQMGVGRNDWAFRLNLDDKIIAKSMTSFISKNTKKLFIVGLNNDFGRGAAAAYKAEVGNFGVQLVGTEFYDDGTTDFRSILTKIKQAGADGVMAIMVEQDSVPFLRQMKEVGLNLRVYSRGGVVTPLFVQMAGNDRTLGDGVVDASYWAAGMDPEGEAHYQARWNSPANTHRMLAYYGMKLVLADAIKRALAAGDLTRASIRDALKTTKLPGTPLGDISFDDHHQAYPLMLVSTIKDGKFVIIDKLAGAHR